MIKMKRQKMTMSTLHCEVCDTKMIIPRKVAQKREEGHVKHMYCPHCKETTAFKESRKADSAMSFWDNWHESMQLQEEK